jgi:pimeloyl-ACP methyl ester carboxylesterase
MKRKHGHDLRGASKIAVEATTRVTDIVQEMHGNIGGFPARVLSAPVYAMIRGIAKLVGVSLDVALDKVGPLLGEGVPSAERDAVVAALNGVVGDWLHETKNPLAIEMRLRHEGDPRKKLVVLVHGSSMNDRQWLRQDHDHGAALARDLDATAVYVHYNSGRRIDESGRELAALLDDLVEKWPVPIESIIIVGHSMGGLVARSAFMHAGPWLEKVDALVTLGTPHHGAPLERIGHIVQQLGGFTKYSAPIAKLGNVRSAGVRDLRHGLKAPLPEGVVCFAMAGGRDGLVPRKSAFGDFPAANVAVAEGIGHLELLDEAVYPQIIEWLRALTELREEPDRPSEARSASPRRARKTSAS